MFSSVTKPQLAITAPSSTTIGRRERSRRPGACLKRLPMPIRLADSKNGNTHFFGYGVIIALTLREYLRAIAVEELTVIREGTRFRNLSEIRCQNGHLPNSDDSLNPGYVSIIPSDSFIRIKLGA